MDVYIIINIFNSVNKKNEIKNVQKEKDNICQLLYVQNSELHKLEEQLYKCNESTSNMINERHLIKSQLDKDNEIYKVEFSKLENEEKLSKILFFSFNAIIYIFIIFYNELNALFVMYYIYIFFPECKFRLYFLFFNIFFF